jgi:hypothetical protein
MKKIKLLFFLIIMVAGAFYGYRWNMDWSREISQQAADPEIESVEFEQLINRVNDADIIRKALKAVGVMGVLEGQEEYRQLLEDENWYSYRGIRINWHYRFAIAVNLEDIGVDVTDGRVKLQADSSKLFLWFLEKAKDSTSHSEASWFARKYTSQEISALEKAVFEKMEMKIKRTPDYWREAEKSLEANLRRLCSDLGYADVDFILKSQE